MLDEAPQLVNVLRGEMSLVGPRPLEPQDDAEVKGWQRARLGLPPGITGPWQALGRHAIPFSEMLTLDCSVRERLVSLARHHAADPHGADRCASLSPRLIRQRTERD